MMDGQRSLADGLRWILLPSALAAFLPFALLWLPPDHWRLAPLIAAAALTTALGVIALRAARERRPGWRPTGLPWAYLVVVVLLRTAGGPSGVSAMVLLPVFWLGLFGTRRQLWCLLVGVALVFVVPLILVGGADYPASAWRAGILFVALSGVVGMTVQALVSHVRDQDRERNRLLSDLDHLAHTDALTGLANRRAWQSELNRALARARRTATALSVALVDIDGFKAVNDAEGHPGGDSLLIEVAQHWTEVLRPDDVLARIGGDEFAVLMPACSHGDAPEVIRRLRARMPTPYSCSIGLATWDNVEDADQLMRRADNVLYDAKRDRPPPAHASTPTEAIRRSADDRGRPRTAPIGA
ncbi:MAG: GGDEF domain-containing protein [Solirubrobacteraceae bacterium]